MNESFGVALIGVGGTVIGTIIGFFLQLILSDINDKKTVAKEWNKIRRMLVMERNEKNFIELMEKLQVLMLENIFLIELNKEFFENVFRCDNYALSKECNKWLLDSTETKHAILNLCFSEKEQRKKRI